MSHVEVDKKSNAFVRKTQVGEKLGKVNGQNLLDGLDFDDHNFCNQEVDAIAGMDLKAVIDNWKQELGPNAKARFGQLVLKAGLVDTFQ